MDNEYVAAWSILADGEKNMSSERKINKTIKKLRNEIEKLSKSLKVFEINKSYDNCDILFDKTETLNKLIENLCVELSKEDSNGS